MREVYPIYLKECQEGGYLISIPDFHNFTEAENLAEAIVMARDAIGALGLAYEDQGEKKPEPFSEKYKPKKEEFRTLVDIDFELYRSALNNRLVKKNCTIPYYLERRATEMGLNFSRILVEALQEKLELGH